MNHSSRYARSLIEASLDPLITISIDGKIMDMNQATVKMTGLTREQLLDTDFFEYFTEPSKAKEVYREVFLRGFVADYPLTMRQGHLTEVLFNGSVYKDENGKVLGAVVVARDITTQKKTETELTEAIIFAELATEIAEEAKAKAEKATKVAEDAVRAKQQFLSNMSHEIRTPMNAILGFTKVLLRSQLDAKQTEYLSAIKLSGDALLILINDILDLAKVDAGKMTFEKTPFKLASSISAMLQLFETTLQEKNLALKLEYDKNIPQVLVGDPIRLRQIILNLVSNAVKFTDAGFVSVRIKLISEDDNKVSINFSVGDTGIGIARNKIKSIFESFQQASKGTARMYGGTGLGLAIVKKLVEAQGGIILLESEVGKGSVFSFEFTFEKTGDLPNPEAKQINTELNAKQYNILVVEDIPLNQLLIKTLLNDFGFNSEYASNGKIAIDLLAANKASGEKLFDIVLMDLQMPVMDGFEATEIIRKTLGLTIPILALSADVTTVDLEKCKASGLDDYITKPVDENELLYKIMRLIKSAISKKEKIATPSDLIDDDDSVDLTQLNARTKGNLALQSEVIALYLSQTPELVRHMVLSLKSHDLIGLKSAIHKMIPSFSILGLKSDPEKLARQVLEILTLKDNHKAIELVSQLTNICERSCESLKHQLVLIQNNHGADRT